MLMGRRDLPRTAGKSNGRFGWRGLSCRDECRDVERGPSSQVCHSHTGSEGCRKDPGDDPGLAKVHRGGVSADQDIARWSHAMLWILVGYFAILQWPQQAGLVSPAGLSSKVPASTYPPKKNATAPAGLRPLSHLFIEIPSRRYGADSHPPPALRVDESIRR